jgi:hypothetical protein
VPANSMTTPVPPASSAAPQAALTSFPNAFVPGQAPQLPQPPVQTELKEEAFSAPTPLAVPMAAGTLGVPVPMPTATPP